MRLGSWLVVLVGCYDPTIPANVPCSPLGECPGDLICRDGTCVSNTDAGVDAFIVVPGRVSVALAGNGTGGVTSSPAGIACPGACSAEFPPGTKVELTAMATGDSWFSGWAGSCAGTAVCSVISDDGASLVATFPLNRHTLTVMKSGDGTGTVTADAGGIDCGATCAQDFDSGTTVVLSASGTSDSSFTGWSGACTGTSPCVVDMSQARDVTATFDCPSGSRTFDYSGSPATLTGRPACVTRLVLDVRGGGGGTGYYNGARGTGGKGGRTQATITVTPSDVITVVVGNVGGSATGSAAGVGGYNGGANGASSLPLAPQFGAGGGGASDVRRNGTGLGERIVVAGGGGGAAICGTNGYAGGDGGGQTGGSPPTTCTGSIPTGGTQTAGGSPGTSPYCTASPGTSGNGGAACGPGGSGGGGGGYFGGGGGAFVGGAGGSGYAIGNATAVTHTTGFQTGAGQVIISS